MADEKTPAKGEPTDPRKVTKYKVSGSFYNPSAKDKTDTFEESVEGEEMSEAGANSAFYQEHSKKYPHYKIGKIEKQEAAKADSDGETKRAGAAMNNAVLSKVADAVMKIADRFGKRMDAEMCRMDAELSTSGLKVKDVGVSAQEIVKKADADGYESAKARKSELEAESARTSGILNTFPKGGPMGLTPDSVKNSSEYKAAKVAYDKAASALRAYNTTFLSQFAKEYKADRRR